MASGDNVPKVFRNEMFYFIARASMLAMSTVGLPVAGFMMMRIINSSDAIAAQLHEQSTTLKILQSASSFRLDNTEKVVLDHETRLRILERGAPR